MNDELRTPRPDYIIENKPSVFGKIRRLLTGVLSGAVVSVLLIGVFSLLMSVTDLPDGLIGVFAYASVLIGAFAAGLLTVKMIKTGGLVNGALAGLLFFTLQFAVSLLTGDGFSFSVSVPAFFVLDVVFSAIGGVVGVNLFR